MKSNNRFRVPYLVLLTLAVSLCATGIAGAQSTASIQGTVVDPQGGAVPDARVLAKNLATGVERTTQTDSSGIFLFPSLPVGKYRLEIRREGFLTVVVNELTLEVGTTVSKTFQLKIGEMNQTVEVSSEVPLVEQTTSSVGQVINSKTVQEIPLNGRHFVDLALLIPGTVTPPQNGFLTAPLRGQGSFGVNTGGAREEMVNFMINGVNLNDMVQNQITFQPSINTVQEFKVDNSTYSAEYGRNAGAIVNIATRSGTNGFHGEAFEYLRNEALDARNFFNPVPITKGPFKRNQFGAAFGGPIWKDHTFFFFSYEGLRQRQGITINSGTLSDAQRTTASSTGVPAVVKLLNLIPKSNATDTGGNAKFIGSATAPVNIDQWTLDLSHNIGANDRLHGYYVFQRDLRQEPVLQGNTVSGFGDTRQSHRQVFTLNETHTISPTLANEARFGFNRIHITFTPNQQLNPTDFNINIGINSAIGLPQISVSIPGGGLNFGGPAGFPQGRGDTTGVFSDTLSWLHGRHSFAFGVEMRRFYNDNFALDIGTFSFTSVTNFINGNADTFRITLGNGASKILQSAYGGFVQDNFKVRSNLTLELGLRYDANLTPSDSQNRFVHFIPGSGGTGSLVQTDQPYQTNNKNFQPRVGFAWDPFNNGKTSVRAAYAILTDQPVTNLVTGLTTNPPFGAPFSLSATTFSPAINASNPSSVAPTNVNPDFKNAYVQSWNLNIQREITPSVGVTVGYFGSKGTHLRIVRNQNQCLVACGPLGGATRPFATLSSSSPILPGVNLSNIFEQDSSSNSSYNALWVTANKRLSRGLQFNASYTYSKSIDYNSLSSGQGGPGGVGGIVVQDSTNIRNDRAVSDFDARHRFVINALYELPFKGHRAIEGWQLSTITQLQSGGPVNILFAGSGFTGIATTRPDLVGSIQSIGDPAFWFNNSVCDPRKPAGDPSACTSSSVFALPLTTAGGQHFGNLGRNAVTGPNFLNMDFSILKNTRITERFKLQFRADFFDIFNHPNFGLPGLASRTVNIPSGSQTTATANPSLGSITSTRFPTGDSGSSRQVQFALKILF